MANTIPKAFFAYPTRTPTLKEAIHGAVPELNEKGQVNIRTWEQCNIGGKFVIDTICNAIDEAELFLADLTGLNANVMFELGYAIACGKRIWLILDDTYIKEKDMFEQLKILTTVGYVSCCNSQDIVSGFYKDKPFADIENTIFRAPIEPILKPYSILYLKSQHENQAALHMSNLLKERFPKKIIVDTLNKPAVQSLADYGNFVFSCSGLVCHFTNPAREDAFLQTARHALICGMAHGFEKPLLMLAEGEFSSPIDYRDFLKHYNTAPQALGYLKEWLPRSEQGLKADQEAAVAPQKIFITYAHQDTEAQKKLKTYLALMEREGKIAFWDDNKILPGDEWEKAISDNLAESDILLYLVSATSLASKNCNKELAEALSANIRVIPIILESCDWLNDRLSDFQALPDKGKPINKWQPESDGWQSVVDGIRDAVEEMETQADTSSGTSEEELRAKLAFQNGNISIMIGQIDRAIEAYSHAIDLYPNNPATYHNRGVAYYIKGDYDRVIVDYTKVIEFKSDDAETYYNRGKTHQEKGDIDLAIADYTKAMDLNPNHANAYNNRGNAYVGKGEYNLAIEDFDKAINLEPNNAVFHNNRGGANSKKGDYDYAIADYTRAVELKPNYAEAYFIRGATYNFTGDYDRAIEDFTKVIQLKSDNADAYNKRGMAYHKQGDIDSAIEDYTKAIDLNADYANAYSNRGVAYNSKRYFGRAITDFNTSIQLNSYDADVYYNRGITYSKQSKVNRAIADYTRAIDLNPKFAEAYYDRANSYREKGDYDRAIVGFTKTIELNPNYPDAYKDRGGIYYYTGEFNLAIADLSKAIEVKPDNAYAYFNRGVVHEHRGEVERAIEDYNAAIKLKPDYSEAYGNRGLVRLQLQEWENFKSEFDTARNMGVDIANGFRDAFGSVGNFERITGVRLPAEIATLLTN